MEQPIGNYLKAKREQRGISLEFICAQTKINFNILKSLELTELDQLPNVAYVRGFVQSYLRTINIDPGEALSILNQNFEKYYFEKKNSKNIQKPKEFVVKPSVPKKNSGAIDETVSDKMVDAAQSLFQHKKELFIVVSFIVFIGGAYYLFNFINHKINSQVITQETVKTINDIKSAEQNLFDSPKLRQLRDAAFNTTKSEPMIVVDSAPLVTPVVEAVPVVKPDVKPEIKTKVEEKIPEVKKVEKVKANSKFPYATFIPFRAGKLFEVIANAPENKDEKLLPPDIKSKFDSNQENILVVGHQDKTWVSYSVDDQAVRATVLKMGAKLFLQGKNIRIFMGNVNATKIFYNNQLIDPMSKNGIKSLVFPQNATEGLFQPLFKANLDGVLFRSEEYMKQMMPEA